MFDDENYSGHSNGIVLNAAMFLLTKMNKGSEKLLGEEIAKIVQIHSIGAAISSIFGFWMIVAETEPIIPTLIGIGFIWSMYYRINSHIDIPFVKNIFESIGVAICTNLFISLVSEYLIVPLICVIPDFGILFDTAIIGLLTYALTIASGIIYLKVLATIEEKKSNGIMR